MFLFQHTSVRKTSQKQFAWLLFVSDFGFIWFCPCSFIFQVIFLSFHRLHCTFCLAIRTHLLTFDQWKRLADAAILSLLTALHSIHANMILLHFHLADARQQRTAGLEIPCVNLLGRWLLQLFHDISIGSQKYFNFVCLQLVGWELWSCLVHWVIWYLHFIHLVHD